MVCLFKKMTHLVYLWKEHILFICGEGVIVFIREVDIMGISEYIV